MRICAPNRGNYRYATCGESTCGGFSTRYILSSCPVEWPFVSPTYLPRREPLVFIHSTFQDTGEPMTLK